MASFLLLAPFSTLAQAPSACPIGCPNDPSILGFATLAGLRCAMNDEVAAIQANPDTARSPPFLYTLCPGTLYQDTFAFPIVPQLDQTIISCGISGSSTNACILIGGAVQVDMSTNATTSPQSPLPLKRVDFYGLTFTSADQAIAAIMNDTISIQALANSDVTAYFVDCHWKVRINWNRFGVDTMGSHFVFLVHFANLVIKASFSHVYLTLFYTLYCIDICFRA